jgi:hypothetical protein
MSDDSESTGSLPNDDIQGPRPGVIFVSFGQESDFSDQAFDLMLKDFIILFLSSLFDHCALLFLRFHILFWQRGRFRLRNVSQSDFAYPTSNILGHFRPITLTGDDMSSMVNTGL